MNLLRTDMFYLSLIMLSIKQLKQFEISRMKMIERINP